MTKDQYLQARISDLQEILQKKHLPSKYRRNQQHALLLYQMDLERSRSENVNFNEGY